VETMSRPPKWRTLLAFAIIYFVWGATFLAIRIGVLEVPPLIFAAMRFLAARLFLYGWMILHGERSPSRRQWRSAFLLALLIFVGDYGLVFWAEQRVPSGITAVMMATIPAFMALSEIVILRTQRLTLRLVLALLVGMCGVEVLMNCSFNLGGQPIESAGAVALILGAICWSIASALSRKLPLPESKVMSSGAQMLAGGVLLTLTAAGLGEFRDFHPLRGSRCSTSSSPVPSSPLPPTFGWFIMSRRQKSEPTPMSIRLSPCYWDTSWRANRLGHERF